MISIPLIRRRLTSELVGRHIYLFGPGSAAIDILCRLADAGAPEGTVVLSATARPRLGAAALFRPHLAIGGAPLFDDDRDARAGRGARGGRPRGDSGMA
ncbi:MAG: hypothetical protein ACRELZ_22210 [Candidatus Rokuibacteriota bacterium]